MTSFQRTTLAQSLLCAALSLILIAMPDVIFWLFEISAESTAYFLARRAGVLFLSLSFVSYRFKSVDDVAGQQLWSYGSALLMGGLMMTGLWEWWSENIGPGVWISIVTELGFALIWLKIGMTLTPNKTQHGTKARQELEE